MNSFDPRGKRIAEKLELKVPPLALWAVFATAIAALGFVVPSANIPFPGHRIVAGVALLGGVLIAAIGVLQFRIAGTSVNPLRPDRSDAIVVSGVYRLSRNPMYLGMAIALIGVSAWTSTIIGYVLVPLYCSYLNTMQIKPEERALLARFGEEFSAYMARVRRWV